MPDAQQYQAALEAGRCAWCDQPAADGSNLCAPHWAENRESKRESMRRLRKRRMASGLCPHCGNERPARSKSCLACRVRRRRLTADQRASIKKVADDKAARIAQATRVHADGRERYHGQQRRGSQPMLQIDEQDAQWASDLITAGLEGLRFFESPEVQARGRFEREDVKGAALSHFDRAQRHLEDILERRGHFKVRHGRRDEE